MALKVPVITFGNAFFIHDIADTDQQSDQDNRLCQKVINDKANKSVHISSLFVLLIPTFANMLSKSSISFYSAYDLFRKLRVAKYGCQSLQHFHMCSII